MDNIFKNAEGYPDRVAGRAIKSADKPPDTVSWLVKTYKELAHLLGYEIVGRIPLKDKDTGRVWR